MSEREVFSVDGPELTAVLLDVDRAIEWDRLLLSGDLIELEAWLLRNGISYTVTPDR